MPITFTHPKWGSFDLILDAHPSLSVNHTVAYGSGSSYARHVQDGLEAINACTTVQVCGQKEVEINRVGYLLRGVIHAQKTYRSMYWHGTMTEKARDKLHDDPSLGDALIAFAETNLPHLRFEALASYQRRVLETVANLRANADAIEKAVVPTMKIDN